MNDELATFHLGDCVEVMATMPDASVDAIVTDPPYGLGFMGKAWDSPEGNGSWTQAGTALGIDHKLTTERSGSMKAGKYDRSTSASVAYQAWCTEWSREAYRLLKPGGYLLAFGGTRTYHRLASAIEDAGFEIRDCLVWAYASGFPKSLDVGKAMDKRGGVVADFSTFRDAVKVAMKQNGVSTKQLQTALGNFMLSHYLTAGSQPAVPNWRDYRIIRDTVGLGGGFDHLFADEVMREVIGEKDSGLDGGSGTTVDFQGAKGRNENGLIDVTAPATDAAKRWQGWGTALKPAWEPIVMARKPLIGTVAANVAAYGTGALNIDGTRIGTDAGWSYPNGRGGEGWHGRESLGQNLDEPMAATAGRWPANVILTDPLFDGGVDGVVGGGETNGGAFPSSRGESIGSSWNHASAQVGTPPHQMDTGTYSRFFLIPKAGRSDREPVLRGQLAETVVETQGRAEGRTLNGDGTITTHGDTRKARENLHPTVKPVELMRHLVRLVTPPGGTVLDCFLGSGSTAIAANMEGFRCIGIEREAEYLEIARARMAHQQVGMGL